VPSEPNFPADALTLPVELSTAALANIGRLANVADYDRTYIRPSILHIGVGGFHRAHLATYVHELLAAGRHDHFHHVTRPAGRDQAEPDGRDQRGAAQGRPASM